MNSRPHSLLVFSVFLLLSAIVCREFYVDPQGVGGACDDTFPGSISSPRCSFQSASRSSSPGDIIWLRGGIHTEEVTVRSAGNATHPIFIKAYPNERPILTDGCRVRASPDYHDLVFEGLYILGVTHIHDTYTLFSLGASNVVVRDCTFYQEGLHQASLEDQWYSSNKRIRGILISGSNVVVESCRFTYLYHAVSISYSWDGVTYTPKTNIVIRGNYMSHLIFYCLSLGTTRGVIAGILYENNWCEQAGEDGIQSNPAQDEDYATALTVSGIVIRQNIFIGAVENGIDLKGGSHCVIENNILRGGLGVPNIHSTTIGAYGGMGGISRGSGSSSAHQIIRHNVLYDNCGGMKLADGFYASHNIIWNNNRDIDGPNQRKGLDNEIVDDIGTFYVGVLQYFPDTAFKNNILCYQYHQDASIVVNPTAVPGGFETDYNAFCANMDNVYGNKTISIAFPRPAPETGTTARRLNVNEFAASVVANGLDGDVRGKEEHSLLVRGEELFINAPRNAFDDHRQYDFSQSSASPVLDRGGPLTLTSAAGSGINVAVLDANWFYDGYGVCDGDDIVVGSNSPVRVVSIDYGAHVITVDSSISWSSGDWVNLAYDGTAPDIGTNAWNVVRESNPWFLTGESQDEVPSLAWLAGMLSGIFVVILVLAVVSIVVVVLVFRRKAQTNLEMDETRS